MCFSAEASFAAGAILLPAGVYCTRTAAAKRPAGIPLALVPIFFGIQQFSEGFVWIGVNRDDPELVARASLVFLAFALGFWPFWAPFGVMLLERRPVVRRWMGACTLFGLLLGGALYIPMALNADEWMEVSAVHHSMTYNPRGLPAFDLAPHELWDMGYGTAVFVPFFIASVDRRFAVFRGLLTVSVVVSYVVFREAFVSVWCFFAAVLSSHLCWIFRGMDPITVPGDAETR